MTTTRKAARSVIVTGGASGLGKLMSGYFAARGDVVTILDIDGASGPAAAAELEIPDDGHAVRFRKCDISSWEEQVAAFRAVYEDTGRVDVVVANAGVSEGGRSWVVPPFPSAAGTEKGTDDGGGGDPEEPGLKVLDVNLVGNIYCMFYLPRPFPFQFRFTLFCSLQLFTSRGSSP